MEQKVAIFSLDYHGNSTFALYGEVHTLTGDGTCEGDLELHKKWDVFLRENNVTHVEDTELNETTTTEHFLATSLSNIMENL